MYYLNCDKNLELSRITKSPFYLILLSCFLALISSVYFASAAFAAGLPVFPGAEGFGTDTRAAYGGGSDPYVYKVTNLNASGSGSLRNCIEDNLNKGPRVCVFEVSGTIKVTSDIVATDPYLTIAGQTAPSPGITVRGAAIHIATHDVLLQHVRIRVGDEPGGPSGDNRDGLKIANSSGNVHHVVADHVSVSWGTDENIQIWNPTNDLTVSNSITSETLDCSIHNEGCHSKNFIIGYKSNRTSVINNLMAHSRERQPLIQSSTEVINNVMYNYTVQATRLAPRDATAYVSIIGNVYLEGPDSGSTLPVTYNGVAAPDLVYVRDNSENGVVPQNPWDLVANEPANTKANSPPIQSTSVSIMDNSDVLAYVLANAGARPVDRDAVDKRIIDDVRNRKGRIIDSQNEVGAWPNLSETRRTLNLPANMHGDNDGDGYTNLEEWLHVFSAEVEGKGNPLPVPPPVSNAPDPPANLRIIY